MAKKCEKCSGDIPVFLNMDGNGFLSFSKVKVPPIQTEAGDFVLQPDRNLEICGGCYHSEFAEKYPGVELPALPPVIAIG